MPANNEKERDYELCILVLLLQKSVTSTGVVIMDQDMTKVQSVHCSSTSTQSISVSCM